MKARIPGQQPGSRNDMMQRIQKMQEDMQAVQEQVENTEFSAGAGGGLVEVTLNGKHELLSVKLQPEVVDPEDVEMLCDMIIAAANEAIRKASEAMEQRMGSATSGLNLPAGLGF